MSPRAIAGQSTRPFAGEGQGSGHARRHSPNPSAGDYALSAGYGERCSRDAPDDAPTIRHATPRPLLRILTRKNVLAGLMFIVIAALGLWVSRNYPIGTALRMSTGYVPRLLCWLLMGLGAIVLVQGLRESAIPASAARRRPPNPARSQGCDRS